MSHPKTAALSHNAVAPVNTASALNSLLAGTTDGREDHSQVSGSAVLWGLIATAVGAISGPSLLDAFFNGSDANEAAGFTIAPYHSSPLLCLVSVFVDLGYATLSLFGRRKPVRLSIQRDTSDGSNRVQTATAVLKLVILVIGVVPQAIQLLGMRGIPVAQTCVVCFVAATTGSTLRSLSGHRTDSSMEDLTSYLQDQDSWIHKSLDTLRWVAPYFLMAAHALAYLFAWHCIAERIPFSTSDTISSVASKLFLTGCWARVVYTLIFMIGSGSGWQSNLWATNVVTPAVWLYPIYSLLSLPSTMIDVKRRQDLSGMFQSVRSAFDALESIDCDLPAVAPAYDVVKTLYEGSHEIYRRTQESYLEYFGNRLHRAYVVSSAAALFCVGAAFILSAVLEKILSYSRSSPRATADLPGSQLLVPLQHLDYARLQLPAHQFINVQTLSDVPGSRNNDKVADLSVSESDESEADDDDWHPFRLFSVPYLTRIALPNFLSISFGVLRSEWKVGLGDAVQQTGRVKQRKRRTGDMVFDTGASALETISTLHDEAISRESSNSANKSHSTLNNVTADVSANEPLNTSQTSIDHDHSSDSSLGVRSSKIDLESTSHGASQAIDSAICAGEAPIEPSVEMQEGRSQGGGSADAAIPGISLENNSRIETQEPTAFQRARRFIKDSCSLVCALPFLIVTITWFAIVLLGIGPDGKLRTEVNPREPDTEDNPPIDEHSSTSNSSTPPDSNASDGGITSQVGHESGQSPRDTNPELNKTEGSGAQCEREPQVQRHRSLSSWLLKLVTTFSVTVALLAALIVSIFLSTIQSVWNPWATPVWALSKASEPKYRDKMWLAFALFNLLTCAAYYLAVFDGKGTRDPSWTDWLGA